MKLYCKFSKLTDRSFRVNPLFCQVAHLELFFFFLVVNWLRLINWPRLIFLLIKIPIENLFKTICHFRGHFALPFATS